MRFEIKAGTVEVENGAIFSGLDLAVTSGEIVTILGPSGCGKTTLLRACCGLTALSSGERWLGDEALQPGIHPDITLLFQQPVLYPHLNVAQNIALGGSKSEGKKQLTERVDAVLTAIGLDGFQQRGVASLSGGEAQRGLWKSPHARPQGDASRRTVRLGGRGSSIGVGGNDPRTPEGAEHHGHSRNPR